MPAFAQVRDGMLARLDEAEDKARHTSVATF